MCKKKKQDENFPYLLITNASVLPHTYLNELLGDPLVVFLEQPDVAIVDRILFVGVETGADEDQVRVELRQLGKDLLAVYIAPSVTGRPGRVITVRQRHPDIQHQWLFRLLNDHSSI